MQFIDEIFGHWSYENGLSDLRESKIISRRRRNFRGQVLKSVQVVTKNESINLLDDLQYSHIDFPAKLSHAITNRLIETVNASVKYSFVNTWGYGDMRYPEKLQGMMGPLVRGEIDVGGDSHLFELNEKTSNESSIFILQALSYS